MVLTEGGKAVKMKTINRGKTHKIDHRVVICYFAVVTFILFFLDGSTLAYAKRGVEVEVPVGWAIWPFVKAWSLIVFVVVAHPKKLILGVILLIAGAFFPEDRTNPGQRQYYYKGIHNNELQIGQAGLKFKGSARFGLIAGGLCIIVYSFIASAATDD